MAMAEPIEELVNRVDAVKDKKHHLVVVTGNPGSGKSQVLREVSAKKKWDYIDCRILVSEEIIELLPAMRAAKAPGIISDLLEKYDAPVLLLDRVQTFFTPVLQLNPLALLRSLSEKYTLVAAWPGYYKDGSLFFERVGEPEALRFDASDLVIWSVAG
jgi:predicted ATP-dependent serine protease